MTPLRRTAREPRALLYLPWQFDLLGGVDVVVDRLWRGLERDNPGAALIGIQDWQAAGLATDAEGRRFLHLNLPEPPSATAHAAPRYLATLARRLPPLRRQLRRAEITVVNAHFPTLKVYPLALLKRWGLWRGRLVLSFHGSDVLGIAADLPAWRLIAAQTDAVTACSRSLAARIAATGLFSASAIRVIHNGIDCDRFAAQAPPTDPAPPRPYLLQVGNFTPHKGQDILIAAFARIAPRFPDLGLVLAGGTDNGVWLAQLTAQVAQLGLGGRVHFLENQSQAQIARLMREAVCLAHSARQEAFGLVIIEAGACGLPVVATAVGGIPEILATPDYGRLAPPDDPAALAAALESLLAAPEQAAVMGRNLRARVVAEFSVAAMTGQYRETLQVSLAGYPAPPLGKTAGQSR